MANKWLEPYVLFYKDHLEWMIENKGISYRSDHPEIEVWSKHIDNLQKRLFDALCRESQEQKNLRDQISYAWQKIREIQTRDLKFKEPPYSTMFPGR